MYKIFQDETFIRNFFLGTIDGETGTFLRKEVRSSKGEWLEKMILELTFV